MKNVFILPLLFLSAGLIFTTGCNKPVKKVEKNESVKKALNKKAEQAQCPQSGAFRLLKNRMNSPRMYFTATLLKNGKALITGGSPQAGWGHELKSVELFDPETETFTLLGDMRQKRTGHRAIALDNGLVALIGGNEHTHGKPLSVELYDPVKGKSTGKVFSLKSHRRFFTATLLPSGEIAIAGGRRPGKGGAGTWDNIELFNPSNGDSRIACELPVGMERHTALIFKNKLLILGGVPTFSDVYSVDLKTWSVAKHQSGLKSGREDHRATVLSDGSLLVTGGSMVMTHASAELFDMQSGGRLIESKMTAAREDHTQTLLDGGAVLITGGEDNGDGLGRKDIVHKSAELFIPKLGRFCPLGDMAEKRGRDDHCAVKLGGGKALILGGEDKDGNAIDTAEIFTQ